MNDMMLYLTTRGRADNQLTLSSMPKKWLERTIIVCPKDEMRDHNKNWPMVHRIQTPNVKNLAEKRQWIFENTPYKKIMMLDDDIQFYVRRKTSSLFAGYEAGPQDRWPELVKKNPLLGKLERPELYDPRLDRMFMRMEQMLGVYAHGSISSRFMNHTVGHEFQLNRRILHVLAYHVPTVLKFCKLGRVLLTSDYEYSVQLMRAGYENAVYCWGAQEDPAGIAIPGGKISGGVAFYRTPKLIASQAKLLTSLHPGIIRLQPFKGDSRYGDWFPTRILINWKKAIKEGLEKRGVKRGTITGK